MPEMAKTIWMPEMAQISNEYQKWWKILINGKMMNECQTWQNDKWMPDMAKCLMPVSFQMFFVSSILSKKEWRQFDLRHQCYLFFVEELMIPKSPFEINWPLMAKARNAESLNLRK